MELRRDTLSYLSDFEIDGSPHLPAAALIEVALAAARETWPGRHVRADELRVRSLPKLPDSNRANAADTATLQVLIELGASESGASRVAELRIASRPSLGPDDAWTLHATASLREIGAQPTGPEPEDLPPNRARAKISRHCASGQASITFCASSRLT